MFRGKMSMLDFFLGGKARSKVRWSIISVHTYKSRFGSFESRTLSPARF